MNKRILLFFGLFIVLGLLYHYDVLQADKAKAVGCPYSKDIFDSAGPSFTVPAGCTKMKVKAWGNGGNSYNTYGQSLPLGGIVATGAGGGGGFVIAEINVSAGQQYYPYVQNQDSPHGVGGRAAILAPSGPAEPVVIAGGGGGGAGSPAGYSSLGSGGAGGGYNAQNGTTGVQGANTAGGGFGATQTSGGAGGTSSSGSCSGNSGDFPYGAGGWFTCSYGATGGSGIGGGGGSAILPNNPGPQYSIGGGGGGGASRLKPGSYDTVANLLVRGNYQIPGGFNDPDRGGSKGLGADGGANVSWSQHFGWPGRIVVIFGEDITVGESYYPPNVDSTTLCGGNYNTSTPTAFGYPGGIPSGCTSRNMVCRAADEDSNDVVCRYQCNDNPDNAYLWRTSCP